MKQQIRDACVALRAILMAPPIEPAPVMALAGGEGNPVAMVVIHADGRLALATRLYPDRTDRQRIESIEALRRTTQHFGICSIVLPAGAAGDGLEAFVSGFKLPAEVRTQRVDGRAAARAAETPHAEDPPQLEATAHQSLCLARCHLDPFAELSRFPAHALLDLPELATDEQEEMAACLADELKRCGETIARDDPRRVTAQFRFAEGVRELGDLHLGMKLPGIVTNVTEFGAFVNVGIPQEGLVHISELQNNYVGSPADVVKPGQEVEVRVLGIDTEKRRLALSMRPERPRPKKRPAARQKPAPKPRRPRFEGNSLGDAFGQLGF